MMVTGLAQRFLESQLEYNDEAPGEGTILEVSEEKGLGTCMDTIIYSGKIKVNDKIVIGTLNELPLVTKVKAMFIVEKNQLKPLKEAQAAIGVKISPQDSTNIIPGMPVKVANKDLEKIKIDINEQIEETTFDIDEEGIILKADSLGSLEALINLMKDKKVKIKGASIGDISKKDIAEADANINPLYKAVVGFSVKSLHSESVVVITNNVIYSVVDKFEEWYNNKKSEMESKQLKI